MNFIAFSSLAQLVKVFPTDESCRKYLEQTRWNGIPICPHCGSVNENHYRLTTKESLRVYLSVGTVRKGLLSL